ncbi:MAG: site-specific integrase [Clostridiales bacterium]|nr:site-specific integrase [Clostridiales bacterium]MBE5747644.1 site-specific integrase [Clostridiales bacterium]
MKYQEWLEKWLRYYVYPYVKERTYQKYKSQTDLHIIPKIGERDMADLSAVVLQEFVVSLSEKGLSTNSVNGVISVLKLSLKAAEKFNFVKKQYTGCIQRPKTREKRVESFSKIEQRKIEEYIFNKNKPKLMGIVLCLYTGLRIGELMALEWSDIDLQKGLIQITKSCHDAWSNGAYMKVLDTPKTQSSERIIPLPKQLIGRLKDWKKQGSGDYVISGECRQGTPVRSYQKTFEGVLKRLKIPHKGFHSLRHTFATRALECGMDVKTLSEILGHKNPMVTLKRYAHSMMEHKTEMMNRLGKLLQ